VTIDLDLCILEPYVRKGTAERTKGNGRDTTFWDITEGAPPGSGTCEGAGGASGRRRRWEG
jgi:hypothetical protein